MQKNWLCSAQQDLFAKNHEFVQRKNQTLPLTENINMWREKIFKCNKRDGENVGHIIRNLVIFNEKF